jgi:CBS domain-containing protein
VPIGFCNAVGRFIGSGFFTMATTLAASLGADRIDALTLRPLCSVEPSTTIKQTVNAMVANHAGYATVMKDGKLVGVFTERDFLNRVVVAKQNVNQPVEQFMTPSPVTIHYRATMQETVELLENKGLRHLPVVGDDGIPIGVLSIKDVVHYLVQYFPANVYNLPPTPDAAMAHREGA